MRNFLLLTALCLALFLPGIAGLPPIDRDESRFAQATRQMVESGDFIRIRFQDEIRAKKPAGIYWLQAASVFLTGERQAIWAYRLPSLLGGLLAVLLLYAFGRTLAGERPALIGSALLASCFLLVAEAHQAKTDAMLLAAVVAAQGVLARLYVLRDRPLGWGLALLFWLAQGIGILIKGPILPMISLLTLLALSLADRRPVRLSGLRPLFGLALLAAMVGPWAWAISQATQGQFIGQAVKSDLLPKLLGAQESHGGAPGTYLALLLLTLWPASLFAIPGLVGGIGHRTQPLQRFLLAWILPNWLVFEAIPTKLPHYILPVYPALTLLAALWLTDPARGPWRGWRFLFGLAWGLIGSALAGAVVAAPLALKMKPLWSLAPLALLLLPLAWAPAVAMARGRPRQAVTLAVFAALIAYGGIFTLLAPRLSPLWISPRLEAMLPPGAKLAAAGFHEPSLVFLHGTATRLLDAEGAAAFLAEHPDGWAAVEASAEPAFQDRLRREGVAVEAAGRIEGFNYSRGRPAQITLWRRQG